MTAAIHGSRRREHCCPLLCVSRNGGHVHNAVQIEGHNQIYFTCTISCNTRMLHVASVCIYACVLSCGARHGHAPLCIQRVRACCELLTSSSTRCLTSSRMPNNSYAIKLSCAPLATRCVRRCDMHARSCSSQRRDGQKPADADTLKH